MFASLSLPVTLLKQVAFFFYFVDACVVYDFFCGFFSLRFFVVFSFWFALWWFLVVPSFSPFTVLLPRTLCLTLCHSCLYNPTPPLSPKSTRPRLKLTRAIEGFQSLFLSKINGVVPCISPRFAPTPSLKRRTTVNVHRTRSNA